MAQKDNNQPTGKPNLTPNNIPSLGGDPKKKNKFNIYWVWGIVIAALIGYNLMRTVATTGIDVNPAEINEIIKSGDVLVDMKAQRDKTGLIVVRNSDIVRVYLKKDSMVKKAQYYKSIMNEAEYERLSKSISPQVFAYISNEEVFEKQLDELYKTSPEIVNKIRPYYTNEGEFLGEAVRFILPLLLFGLLLVMMMRKMGGGGAWWWRTWWYF
jgi:AFG3 family protein